MHLIFGCLVFSVHKYMYLIFWLSCFFRPQIHVFNFLVVLFFFQSTIDHVILRDLLKPIQELFEDVRRKAMMRLEYEGLHKAEAIATPGARFYQDPAGFAMDRYAYYVCFKCKKVRNV